MKNPNAIFEDLFVLELANNHWGKLERGLKIIEDYGHVVRFNGVKAAIKLQLRDVDHFIHKDFRSREDIRYIKKTLATVLTKKEYVALVKKIMAMNCIPMATPFDEASVDLCEELGVKIIKIASSDLNDWVLIERIAKTKLPVIVSTGGSNLKDIDDLVKFFDNRNIPLAINHCVSLYPSKDSDLELNQIDFLKERYPDHIIGLSTHEIGDLTSSMLIAYAKGARTIERHIDIDFEGVSVSPYCSLPNDVDVMFKAYELAKVKCGGSSDTKRIPPKCEVEYLDALVRGVYANRDLEIGERITDKDVYLAVPLQKGQLSCRELMSGEMLICSIKKDDPINIDDIDSPYAHVESLKKLILNRGL
ncbi:MAG: N-acetylneuraminate synthase family protein [Acholeplasmataceae bacterium]|nr:N-acetylneuraminate synthase family protein [Acholeplasmataceae bacterium]